MMPIMLTRRDIEILLDRPDQRDYVVSAYADLTVRDGFRREMERHLENEARAVREVLGGEARKQLDADIDIIRDAVAAHRSDDARGLAVFAGAARGLKQVIPLDFDVEDRLVIDEDPYLLPLLAHLCGEPAVLVALVDANHAHFFVAHEGKPDRVRDLEREDIHQEFQRDRPRFSYKKRFTSPPDWHEYLHGAEDAPFLRRVAAAMEEQMRDGRFAGLILLGRKEDTAALRRLLPRQVEELVIAEAHHAMTDRPEDIHEDVDRLVSDWQGEQDRRILDELGERWKQDHLVADGPTAVLDALQQGRAARVVIGRERDIPGAHCTSCGYRLGAPVEVCPYCQGRCRTVNALQDILKLAMRHRVPVHRLHADTKVDPLDRAGGVAAMVHAPANWAPDKETARASQGKA